MSDVYVYGYSTLDVGSDFLLTSVEALKSFSATQFVLQNTAGIFKDQLVYIGNFTTSAGGVNAGTITELKVENDGGTLEVDIRGLDVSISNGSFSTGSFLSAGSTYFEASSDSVLSGEGDDTYVAGNGTRVFPGGGVNTITGSGSGAGIYFTGSLSEYTLSKAADGDLVVADSTLSRNGYNDISGNFGLTFEGDQSYIQYSHGVLGLTATASAASQYVGTTPDMQIAVVDSAANIDTHLDALQNLAAMGKLFSISFVTGSGSFLDVTATQLTADAEALQSIQGSYTLAVTGMSVQAATGVLANNINSITVSDSAAHVFAALDTLESLIASGKLDGVTLTDTTSATATITSTQDIGDAAVLSEIKGSYALDVTAGTMGGYVRGFFGVATTVMFTDDAAAYTLTSSGNGSGLTVTGPGGAYHLSDVQALQFADNEVIVAATPGAAGAVTTGNLAELYGAVFGREPDVGGLAFYQAYMNSNPTTPLLQYAEWFLASTEYTSNPEHAYAQTVAGDQQFISDSYQNLLHRAPNAAEVAFYEDNVIAPALQGLQAGTAGYAAADLAAHALTLVYFSASPEFLSNVQVTASNPSSAQHWLILV